MNERSFDPKAGTTFQDVVPGVEVAHLVAIESGRPVLRRADGSTTRGLVLSHSLKPSDVGEKVLVVQAAGSDLPVVLGALRETVEEGEEASVRREEESDESRRRVRIEATTELDLRCGEASLSMRRNGKIVLRGVEITSRASRANKVKGGTVRIN